MLMTRRKVLIDCDPGHDDAVAILYAARRLDVVAITTVHGNTALESTTRNALALLELAGLDIPVAVGAAAPLVGPRQASAPVHGATGLDGAVLPVPTRAPLDVHAVDLIIETAARLKGELTLAVIGPATNIAMALHREPRLAGWVREITIMGGSTTRGNVTPAAEFNVHSDSEAASVVFGSGAPLRMVGLDVTRRTGMDEADLDRLRASGRGVAGVVADLIGFYLARQRERRGPGVVAPMHDVCALVPLVDPTLLTYVDARVDVELAGRHTRGMTVVDLRPPGLLRDGAASEAPVNATVAIESDSRRVIDSVISALVEHR
jgi:inosine-uridine nucleoside N-ribohydrolase